MSSRPLVTIEEARRRLDEAGLPVARTERCVLEHLHGRVLACPLVEPGDVPLVAGSAMVGYAVRAGDTAVASAAVPVRLRVVDEAWAGRPAGGRVQAGTAIAIATGAVLPDGADAVVMVEDTTRSGDVVDVRATVASAQHVSPRGSDLIAGSPALEAGDLLTPARVGVVAALGLTSADVYVRPMVAILSSGDEVVTPGAPLGPGPVHDVNTHTLAAIVRANGGEPLVHDRVADQVDAVERAVRATSGTDLVLLSGGSSVGGRDYVLDVLARHGEIRFHGIAVKPGKPTVLAIVDGRPVLGMPGNPTSCLSNGYLLVAPLVRRLARLPPLEPRVVAARLARAISSPPDRHQFYTVRLAGDVAEPAFKGSGDITSMARADGYVEIPVGTSRLEAGDVVNVTLFS
jgi:molybdenum cofactor synthesis domain-containing protein